MNQYVPVFFLLQTVTQILKCNLYKVKLKKNIQRRNTQEETESRDFFGQGIQLEGALLIAKRKCFPHATLFYIFTYDT